MSPKDTKLQINNWKTTEIMVYWLIWTVILFLPLIFWDFNDAMQRRRIIGGWIRIFPFLIIFLIHNQILLPKFLLKNKYAGYFISTILLILVVNYIFIYTNFFHDLLDKIFDGINASGNNLEKFHEGHRKTGSHTSMHHGMNSHYKRWHTPYYLVYTYNVIISILIVGFNATLKYTTRWLKEEQNRKEIERETFRSQLRSLQHQVNPHFFMNTLNNIHALIEYNKKDAQEAILRLSKMMRYLLYDLENGKTTLQKEIDFLNSYIDLMKLRISESVDLIVHFPSKVPEIEIHPYLFISFLENAFKFGIENSKNAFVHIILEVVNDTIHFNVKNSKYKNQADNGDYSGFGIENARKRLNLLFGTNYELRITDSDNEFEINLIVPYED